MASIEVKLFASLREAIGYETQFIEFEHDLTVNSLFDKLSEHSDAFAEYHSSSPILVAVNQTMVDTNYIIKDADEVALFPPVTGG